MMILKYRNSEEYSELQEKLRKIKRLSEELEDFLCNTEEETSYEEIQRTSYRDNYDRSDYDDNTSRTSGRYHYARR